MDSQYLTSGYGVSTQGKGGMSTDPNSNMPPPPSRWGGTGSGNLSKPSNNDYLANVLLNLNHGQHIVTGHSLRHGGGGSSYSGHGGGYNSGPQSAFSPSQQGSRSDTPNSSPPSSDSTTKSASSSPGENDGSYASAISSDESITGDCILPVYGIGV